LAGAAADKEDSPLFALEAAPPLEDDDEEEDETAAWVGGGVLLMELNFLIGSSPNTTDTLGWWAQVMNQRTTWGKDLLMVVPCNNFGTWTTNWATAAKADTSAREMESPTRKVELANEEFITVNAACASLLAMAATYVKNKQANKN
jgi:hypothetical protein